MKIIIADPNRLRAQAFSDLLLSFPQLDLEVPPVCLYIDELMGLVSEERPHLVFISVHFGEAAFMLVRQISHRYHPYTLSLITGEESSATIMQQAVRAGAYGIFISPIVRQKLLATVRLLWAQVEELRKTP